MMMIQDQYFFVKISLIILPIHNSPDPHFQCQFVGIDLLSVICDLVDGNSPKCRQFARIFPEIRIGDGPMDPGNSNQSSDSFLAQSVLANI